LGRPVQFLEQPPHVVLVVVDAELLLDHLGNASTGLDLEEARFPAPEGEFA